jgi:peptidoglycan-N-acetylglucosamine deacetylase
VIARLIAGAALAANAAPAPAPLWPALAAALGIPTRLADAGAVALTFDDGPHPRGTPAVLEALAAAGATATFFLAGEQVGRRPTLAAEIVAAGHEVGVHCFQHRNALRLGPKRLLADVRRAAEVISAATGRAPRLHRPPYGIYTASGLWLARREGLDPLLWSAWGRDWAADATPASICNLSTSGLRGGDVVLLHDADYYSAAGSWQRTAAALPTILNRLAERNLRSVAARSRERVQQPTRC